MFTIPKHYEYLLIKKKKKKKKRFTNLCELDKSIKTKFCFLFKEINLKFDIVNRKY
jgi:hypothetical protein